jgi:hypothetical protein
VSVSERPRLGGVDDHQIELLLGDRLQQPEDFSDGGLPGADALCCVMTTKEETL